MQLDKQALTTELQNFFAGNSYESGIKLANHIHQVNVKAGWWNDPKTGQFAPRPWGRVIALASSEIAEALEADRKSLMDDKLTHRLGRDVEIADLFIRLMDTFGGFSIQRDVMGMLHGNELSTLNSISALPDFSVYCAELNLSLFRAYDIGRSQETHWQSAFYFAILLSQLIAGHRVYNLGLVSAVVEKMEFNAHREDHKMANRLIGGGKAY